MFVLNKKHLINTYYTLDDESFLNKVKNQPLSITPNMSYRVSF